MVLDVEKYLTTSIREDAGTSLINILYAYINAARFE